MKATWGSMLGFTLGLGGLLCGATVVGCGGRGTRATTAAEPTYQTPPLPAWSAEPPAAAPLDQSTALGDQTAGEWLSEEPEKPAEPEKSVDLPPDPGQNSSTAPPDRGTVAPPQSD